jgi:hypothetical protein
MVSKSESPSDHGELTLFLAGYRISLSLRETYMFLHFVLALFVAVAIPVVSFGQDPSVVAASHTYEAGIRVDGKVSTTRVQASDARHAKKLVQTRFPNATVLSVKKVD